MTHIVYLITIHLWACGHGKQEWVSIEHCVCGAVILQIVSCSWISASLSEINVICPSGSFSVILALAWMRWMSTVERSLPGWKVCAWPCNVSVRFLIVVRQIVTIGRCLVTSSRTICKGLLIAHEVLQFEKCNQCNPTVSSYELYLPLRGHCFVNNVLDVLRQHYGSVDRVVVRQCFHASSNSLETLNEDFNRHGSRFLHLFTVIDQCLSWFFSDEGQFPCPNAYFKLSWGATKHIDESVIVDHGVPILLDCSSLNLGECSKELISCVEGQFFSCFKEFVESIKVSFDCSSNNDRDFRFYHSIIVVGLL
jgi:hypothetical protein